jgi:hypothetical protein
MHVRAIPHDVQEAGGGKKEKEKKPTITVCTKTVQNF